MTIEEFGTGNQTPVTAVKLGVTGLIRAHADEQKRLDRLSAPSKAQAASEIAPAAASTLEFSIDGDSGKPVIKIIDSETRELVRQIPMEEMLVLAKSLDQLKGLLLHTKA